jgi:hypothetical protein
VTYQKASGAPVAGTGGSTQGKQEFFLPASAMRPTISSGAGYPETLETAANAQDITYIPFDPTTAENAVGWFVLPKKWNLGTLTAKFYWSHPATTTNFGVMWGIQLIVMRDGDPRAVTTWGTQVTQSDTGGTTNNLYVSAETGAVTPAGTAAAGCQVWARVARLPSDAADTMAVDARLEGVMFSCTTNADTDA